MFRPRREPRRSGIQFEGLYTFPVNIGLDVGVGFKFEREVYVQRDPIFNIPSNRFFLIGEFLMKINDASTYLEGVFDKVYLGVGGGLGRSQSEVDTLSVVGDAFLFPVVKLGI